MRRQRDRFGAGRLLRAPAWVLLGFMVPLLCVPAAIARDTGQIRITLTVPQTIRAQVSPGPARGSRFLCVMNAESTPFSVAGLIRQADLKPLRPAGTDSNCVAGVAVSIEAHSGGLLTLLVSPE